jgi:hypothetical protein
VRHDRTIERNSVKSLKDLRSLVTAGHFQQMAQPNFDLRNTIDGERDSVKVAVYKFLSDHLERSVAGIVDALEGYGYEHDTVICAVHTLVNEGCLASHRYGNSTDPQDTGVRLLEGRYMPEVGGRSQGHRLGMYRHATTVSHRDPHGTLNHRDGVEAAIWKAMQDHAIRRLDTVVEIVRVAGFAPAVVRGEIMLLEQLGWFEIDRSGDEPTCRLRDGIEMPSKLRPNVGPPQQEEFNPAQPAEPGSLLAKVQQAQVELDDAARPTPIREGSADLDGHGGGAKKSSLFETGRERICQILAGGLHLSTMEIYSALKAGNFNLSKSRTYQLVKTLHGEGLLCRNKEVPESANVAYRYWLAQCLPATVQPEPATWQEVPPPAQAEAPLVISVHLRGVELTLKECGELLQEISALWFLKRWHDDNGLIRSHFTIKSVELSLEELLEVATYLADAAAYLGCMPRHQNVDDDEIFPKWSPAA